MANKLLLLNVVGLSPKHIGAHTPNLSQLAAKGCNTHIQPMLPAVTCSVQTTYFTGKTPAEHGIVGNGWYFKDQAEIRFWHQSNHLIQAEQIWDQLKKDNDQLTSANVFCWYNMYCPADTAITVRPMYPADGRKIPDIYTTPGHLRAEMNKALGSFPLFNFWGPKAILRLANGLPIAPFAHWNSSHPTLPPCTYPTSITPFKKSGLTTVAYPQNWSALMLFAANLSIMHNLISTKW